MDNKKLLASIKARLPAPSERQRLEVVSKGSGVPYHTLLKIAKGETADPRLSTIQSLVLYFDGEKAA